MSIVDLQWVSSRHVACALGMLAMALVWSPLASADAQPRLMRAARAFSSPTVRTTLSPSILVAPTLRVQLTSGTQRTIEVSVPRDLGDADSVAFHVNRAVAGAVGGAGDGVFMRSNATVPVTIRASETLAPGAHRVADVRFWSADGRGDRIVVPIELTIVASAGAAAGDTLRADERRAATLVNAPSRSVRVGPTHYVTAAPRSVHIVRVPVPEPFAGTDSIAFAVSREAGIAVSGPAAGFVAGDDAHVLLSVSVPSQARAGRLRAASVVFRPMHGDSVTIVMPVEVLVEAVHAVSLSVSSPMVHAVQGRRTTVRVIVNNAGNVEDTVQLSVTVPDQWRGAVRDAPRVVVAPGASVVRDVELTAPRDASTGTSTVAVYAARFLDDASTPDASTRTLSMPVEVLPSTAGAAFGPMLGVSYNAVQQPGRELQGTWGLTLNGPLARNVSISASWTQRALYGTPGASRVGGGTLFPTMSLFHARWQLHAGNASADLGDVAGLVRSGRGVSFSYGDTLLQVTALAARPFTFGTGARSVIAAGTGANAALDIPNSGTLAGARVRLVRNALAWSATASHLRDPLLTRASLDALSVGLERAVVDATTARGELAWRRWDTSGANADPGNPEHGYAAAFGAAAELGQRSTNGDWRLRATHAPGGSAAFARARTDVTMPRARRLGDVRPGYVGFYAADEGLSGVQQQTHGIGVLPQLTLGRQGAIGLEARVGASQSGEPDALLSTMSQILGLFGSTRLGSVMASTSASYTRTTRDLGFEDAEPARVHEGQVTWSTQMLWPLSFGTLDVYSSLQRRMGSGALSDGQHDLVLRADQIAVPFVDGRVQLSAAVGRTVSLGSGAQVFTQRVGVSTSLPFATYLRVDLERNPYLGATGANGWTTALRIERAFGTPSFLRAGRGTGVVFEDRNGNGVREADEPGLPGVLVRVGSEYVVTDRRGEYQLTKAGAGIPSVDERSLPFGLMIAPQAARAAMTGLQNAAFDIPVVPVGAVEVQLDIAPDALLANTVLSLRGVVVSAVDAAGRRHLARMQPDGRAVFDALPPGEYRLEVDGSAAEEPLALQGAALQFRLDGASPRQLLRAVLGPRRVRLFRAPSSRRTSATGTP